MIVIVLLGFFLLTSAQWTPDPDCPWPIPADETVYMPYPGDCSRYIECFDGGRYVYQCSDGLWWHQEIENCDYPGDYCDNSGNTGTPDFPTPTPTPPIGPTPGADPRCVDNNNGYWSHPTSCNAYIECFQGASYEMVCPKGLYFSESQQGCVNREESECCIANPRYCGLTHKK